MLRDDPNESSAVYLLTSDDEYAVCGTINFLPNQLLCCKYLFSRLYPYMFGKKKHKAKEAGFWPISLTETKLRSIKLYPKKNESNNQAKKRTFSCGKSRGARLAHLDHSSSKSECRICLILPACGFSHIIITTRTRTRIIIYSLYLLRCALQLPSEDEVLLQKLREESRAVFLQRKSRELLDNDELQVRRSS